MTNDDEKSVGILFLTLLNSKATINACIKKSGMTADKISTIISTPKFNRYFEKKTDEELYISSKVDWISDEIGHRIKINDSEAEILKESVQKKFINHVNKFWKEKGVAKRDFEIKNLPEWIISEYVFLSGFTMWFREKEKDDETDLSGLLSNATGEDVKASASIDFDQERLELVSEIPTQILEKIMNINPAGKIAYRSLDMAIMKAMSEGNPEFAEKMKNKTVKKKSWFRFW
ncbi:MAG: hypothetical protein VXX45_02795 [Candidatus Thermoplasmatota archaeon]|nr:hypothetical protein [Candidatus Thermoplasmatota archaeon]